MRIGKVYRVEGRKIFFQNKHYDMEFKTEKSKHGITVGRKVGYEPKTDIWHLFK